MCNHQFLHVFEAATWLKSMRMTNSGLKPRKTENTEIKEIITLISISLMVSEWYSQLAPYVTHISTL